MVDKQLFDVANGFVNRLLTPESMPRFNRGRRHTPRRTFRARRTLFGNSRSLTRTNTKRRRTTQRAPTTFQHDFSFLYGRKRAPRRVRRRARRAAGLHLHNTLNLHGQKSAVFQDIANLTLTPTSLHNSQNVSTVGMYGGAPSSAAWGDLYNIASNESLLSKTGKICFKSAVMDVQIRNNHETDVLVIDVYQVLSRKEGVQEPGQDWIDALTNVNSITGMSSLSPTELNCTPFDAPQFCSDWLMVNKVRYRISPGLSIYLQLRDSKDYKFNTSRFQYEGIAPYVNMFKGLTKGYLFVARSSNFDTTTPKALNIDYDVIATKIYHYSILFDADDHAGVQ